ncbi:hypothetical protein JRO89_XS03G0300600 [Xanthoceras sorbifolium]|uniref:BRCT domain-containing protein n=1 Tax=Xanthoceras sorbifolium TaxID=99658 RepID=A0ABQ8ICV1_9ROSI|nr:hypothetical protein JRO89_XS03G0300600 [Xanthoceras sorbifolium]
MRTPTTAIQVETAYNMGSVSAPESSIAEQGRAMFAMHVWSTMKELDDLDYDTWTQWKLEVEVILGMMDLDLALREDKPSTPTETSLPEEKSKYEKWEKSNSLSLLLMRSKMSNYVRSFVPGSENVKQYFAGIENLVAKFEEDGAFLFKEKEYKSKGLFDVSLAGGKATTRRIAPIEDLAGGKATTRRIARIEDQASSLPSFRGVQSFETMSPASTSSVASESAVRSNGPFSGLVICVTGLSKEILGSNIPVTLVAKYKLLIFVLVALAEARRQVMEATERLGGRYSPDLHPQCTHLVVQISFNFFLKFHFLFVEDLTCLDDICLTKISCPIYLIGVIFLLLRCFLTLFYSLGGRKLEHALKHGSRNGLFVVTLGWFVDSVRKNVRLSESLYTVKSIGEHGMHLDKLNRLVGFSGTENSCLPAGIYESKQHDKTRKPNLQFSDKESNRSTDSTLSGHYIYVDSDISEELQNKVFEAAAKEGATLVNQWFVGCSASHVVCEGTSVQRYLGHSNNLVTPLWVLKTAKEKSVQRLVHMSADLARQVGMMLETLPNGTAREEINGGNVLEDARSCRSKTSHEKRQEIVNLAKNGVRNRRGRRMQASNQSY